MTPTPEREAARKIREGAKLLRYQAVGCGNILILLDDALHLLDVREKGHERQRKEGP